ncbi:helix-hairpin-helix domain-containing protein [Chryseobacterium nematophagum]|uniref:helix-hairpin-helix domain-containing protein n=1 Tax=Chryseobacterium nematophagum TaxID=2305228 RepID=UPI001E55FE4C|nr:hypothetical protein [Chryseobacterium nematophagum]
MAGAQIHVPCVNESRVETSLQGNQVYLGFMHIQNLENRISHFIIEERKRKV